MINSEQLRADLRTEGLDRVIPNTDLQLVENLEQKLSFRVVACISEHIPYNSADWYNAL